MIQEGDHFPDFSLPDQDGNIHSLSSLSGKKSVIYFYPKDDTSGCTLEACEFRDEMPNFEGANVLGVSPDPVKKHVKFASKHSLNFPLLADEKRELIEPLELWVEKMLYGRKYMGVRRSTFLLDEKGKVLKVWLDVKPEGHAAEVLSALKG